MRLSKSKLLSRFLKSGFSTDKLKSPNNRKFSYEELKKFNASFISFMKDNSFCESGLQFPSSYHFLFVILNSNTILSDPSLKSHEFTNLLGIPTFMNNIRPPPFLFLSFRNVLKPTAKSKFNNVKEDHGERLIQNWFFPKSSCGFRKKVYYLVLVIEPLLHQRP